MDERVDEINQTQLVFFLCYIVEIKRSKLLRSYVRTVSVLMSRVI